MMVLKRSASDMAGSSVRLAEDGREGHGEDLAAYLVGDAQLPAAPVFRIGLHQHRAHQAVGMREGFGEIAHGGAAAVDQVVVGVGAVEIDFSHVPHPSANRPMAEAIAALMRAKYPGDPPSGNYGKCRGFESNQGDESDVPASVLHATLMVKRRVSAISNHEAPSSPAAILRDAALSRRLLRVCLKISP